MSGSLFFRKPEASDFKAVLNLASQLAVHIEAPVPSLTPMQFAAYYVVPSAPMHLLLAIRNGQVVGMISWITTHELYSAEARVYISDLAVDQSVRSQGIGMALMSQVRTWAQSHRIPKLAWEVWHRNTQAKAFYKKLGAEVDQEAVPYVLRGEVRSTP